MNSGRTSRARKGGKDDKNLKDTESAQPQKKRPTVMEIRKLEAMLQVANEKAEAERKAKEEEEEAEKKEIMELRQATTALR